MVSVTHGRWSQTYIAKLVFFPCGGPPPWLGPFVDVVLGGTADSVALYARRVAKMYPGVVGGFPLLIVLLIAQKDSLRSSALKSPNIDWLMWPKRSSIRLRRGEFGEPRRFRTQLTGRR